MTISLSSIYLETHNTEMMIDYLSYIFDMEIIETNEDITLLSLDPYSFYVKKIKNSKNSDMTLDFKVSSENELKEYFEKSCFKNYINDKQTGATKDTFDCNKIIDTYNSKFFCTRDPDGRIWRFSCDNQQGTLEIKQ